MPNPAEKYKNPVTNPTAKYPSKPKAPRTKEEVLRDEKETHKH